MVLEASATVMTTTTILIASRIAFDGFARGEAALHTEVITEMQLQSDPSSASPNPALRIVDDSWKELRRRFSVQLRMGFAPARLRGSR